jgi:hypothetical protein
MRALARAVKFGARPKLTKNEISQSINDYEAPGCSKMEVTDPYGISRSSAYRIYSENCQPMS